MRRTAPPLLTLGLTILGLFAAAPGRAAAQRAATPPMVTPESLTDVEIGWAIDALRDGLYA